MKTLGKKTMVLAGAMAFSMAMGTFAYADTKAPEQGDVIAATKCSVAATVVDAKDQTAKMKLIEMPGKTGMTKIVLEDGSTVEFTKLVDLKTTNGMTMSIKTVPAQVIQK